MSYFESNRISVYPTAYRQYVDSNNETIKVNPEARVNTEYNTTHLIDGLVNHDINNGNFVVDYDSTSKFIKFCMQGYYFNLDLSGLNITDLYVKINIVNTVSSTDWKYVYELVPINYDNSNRDLDYKDTSDNKVKFIGLDYVTSNPTSDYFALLVGGAVPDKSKLEFSTKNVGYFDGTNWYPISTKFTTTTFNATTINDLTLTKNAVGFTISGGTTLASLSLTANITNSGVFTNSNAFTNTGAFSNTNTFTNSGGINNTGSFTNNATTTINKNFTVGANSTYTGGVEIKSKNNLSIVGDNTSDSTLTFNGTSVFQSGNYASSLTGGEETITLGGNTFNVVTRDTTQNISGTKTFTSPVTITSTTQGKQSLQVGGSIVACKENNTYKVLVGNFDTNYYGIKFDTNKYIAYKNDTQVIELKNSNGVIALGSTESDATTTQNGTVRVTGGISATKKCYFDGLSLTDDYITLNNKTLKLGGKLTTGVYAGTQKDVYINTKDNTNFTLIGGGTVTFNGDCTFDGGSYSLDNTSGSESVTIAGKTLNVVTRDTVQTITANKVLDSSKTLFFGSQGSTYNIAGTGVANLKDLYVRSGGIYVYNSGSARQFYVSSTGNVYANQFNGNYYSSSDIRLKENIVPFENKKSILDLPIKRFDYINGKKDNIGCIAQDLQKLYPELVTTNEDGYLSIEETKLVYLLIDEVKKLKEEVDKLKK